MLVYSENFRWRWIFILEGLLTVIVSIFTKFFIVGWPEDATFLSPPERLLLKTRLANETPSHLQMSRLDRLALTRVFSDWKIYVGMLMYFGVVNTGYATSFFIPTIVLELKPGATSAEAQVKSIPIFMVAAAVSLMVAWATDKVKHRYGFCMAGVAVASTGYVILLCQESVSGSVRYMACFFVTVRIFCRNEYWDMVTETLLRTLGGMLHDPRCDDSLAEQRMSLIRCESFNCSRGMLEC